MTIGKKRTYNDRRQKGYTAGQMVAPSLERVAALASALFQTPVAMVALAENERPWFVAQGGIDTAHFDAAHDLCMIALRHPHGLVIPDTTQHQLFANHPLVAGTPHIRFLAGLPIHAPNGIPVGALCLIDTKPRHDFTDMKLEYLQHLGALIEAELFRSLACEASEIHVADRVTFIGEFLHRLDAADNEQAVLQAAVQGLAELFKAETTFAFLSLGGRPLFSSSANREAGRPADDPDLHTTAERLWAGLVQTAGTPTLDRDQASALLLRQMLDQCPDWEENAFCTPLLSEKSGCIGFLVVLGQTACEGAPQAQMLLHRLAELTARALARVQGEVPADYFRYLFEKNPNPMWVYDAETWHFLAVNEAAVKLYGYSEDAFKRMTIRDIRPVEDVPALELVIGRNALSTSLRRSGEWRHVTADGRLIDVEVDGFPIQFKGRQAVLVVSRDITARKQAERRIKEAEERLHQAEKLEAIGQLTGGIAHDFGNILTVILSNIELLESELQTNPGVGKRLAAMRRAAESAGQMTQRLLAFARKQSHAPEQVELTALITRVVDLLRQALPASIETRLELPSVPVWVELDSSQLDSALINLAMNARDAMPNGGTITFGVKLLEPEHQRQGTMARITVSDTGTGMSREVLRHATEPFFTTKGVGRGTGLGLSMVYGFVTQAGGIFEIDSAPGKGTRIHMVFQARKGTAANETRQMPVSNPVRGLRVLLVEDDELVREALEDMIRQLGCTVIAVPGPQWALDLLASDEQIDVMLTDVVLNGLQKARDIIRIMQLSRPDLPVIYCSGHPYDALFRQGLLPADAQLLGKPFTVESLREALTQAVRKANRPVEAQ